MSEEKRRFLKLSDENAKTPNRGFRIFPLLIIIGFGRVLIQTNTSLKEARRMELSIIYECPQCGKTIPKRVVDLAPGAPRQCTDCGAATHMTEKGLMELQRDLEDFCRS